MTYVECPMCEGTDTTESHAIESGTTKWSTWWCSGCEKPFVIKSVVVETIHLVEGIAPYTSSPKLPAIEEIRKEVEEYEAEVTGTHPDPDQFLCSRCSCLVELHKKVSSELTHGEKVCESCFYSDAYQSRKTKESEQNGQDGSQTPSGNEQKPVKTEQNLIHDKESNSIGWKSTKGNDWQPTPGNKNAMYRCLKDVVEVKYGVSGVVKLTHDDVQKLAITNGKLTSEIMAYLGKEWTGNKNAAISTFIKAFKTGNIPEAPEAV